MKRPLTKDKIVYDPERQELHLVSSGLIGSPRPFRNITKILKDGSMFSVSEARVNECVLSDAGQSFGTKGIQSRQGKLDVGATRFEELPPDVRKEAVDLARKWCVGLLESTEIDGKTNEEIQQEFEEVLEEIEQGIEEDLEEEITEADD